MKELQQPIQDKVTIVNQKEVKKEHQFIGSVTLQKGQQAWQLNLDTGTVELAEFKSIDTTIGGQVRKRLEIKPRHLYVGAINKRNAYRKFNLIMAQQ